MGRCSLGINRRTFSVALAAAAAAQGAPAQTGTYPSQPVRIIVPFAAGGSVDVMARMIGQKISEGWGVPVIVDNRPGASGTIGADAVMKAKPDGHTVLLTISSIVQTPLIMKKPPYDVVKDFKAASLIASAGAAFSVPQSLPVANLKEFVAYAKANPNKINYGSFGNGSTAHLLGSLLNRQAGISMVQVPYKGLAPLTSDFIGGQLTAAFTDVLTAKANPNAFKVLAVGGATRSKAIPDVPTFTELGYAHFQKVGWMGFFMNAETPDAIVARFAGAVARVTAEPSIKAKIEELGYVAENSTTARFGALVKEDAAFYARMYKELEIHPE